MFDPRLYRTAMIAVLLAVIAAAFSLEGRPGPITTTLAPDAFNPIEAQRTLSNLQDRFPDRRPGSLGDDSLAREVATAFRQIAGGTTTVDSFEGDTIDGRQTLRNVIFSRPGEPGPGIVVVAHRDAAGRGSVAELSATAILLELARVAGDGRTRRTITFVSTSGGSGGLAGAGRLASRLAQDEPIAVLVVGDGASRNVRKPTVIGWSNGKGQAPIALQRTVQESVRIETGRQPGAARAPKQWGRLAFPLTTGEQGAFGRAGIPSVLIQASGERGPAAADPVSSERMETYGRAALRTIYALDETDDDPGNPAAILVAQRKLVPYWAIQLVVAALLLVPFVVCVDGYARIRRRGELVGRWGVWAVSWALPFAIACVVVIAMKFTGIIGVAPSAPIPGPSLHVGAGTTIGIISIFVIFALTLLFVRPRVLRALAPDTLLQRPSSEAAAMAVMLTMTTTALIACAVNAFAAALLAPAVHVWMLALSPQARLNRFLAALLVLLSTAPLVILALLDASAFGWSLHQLLWSVVQLIAGGHASTPIWLLSSLVLGSTMSALVVALRLERVPRAQATQPERRARRRPRRPFSFGR